jgi:hypothetical protein
MIWCSFNVSVLFRDRRLLCESFRPVSILLHRFPFSSLFSLVLPAPQLAIKPPSRVYSERVLLATSYGDPSMSGYLLLAVSCLFMSIFPAR